MRPTAGPGRPLRVVIVDDEPLARQALRDVLRRHPELEMIAECADGESAIEAVRRTRPEILLLDVQMPEIDGFEVLRRLEPDEIPAVIFVTAYDEYAVDAFERQALDYVLKPFSEDRLEKAIERAKARVHRDGLSELGRRVLELTHSGDVSRAAVLKRLAVPKGNRTLLVEVERIDWLEAADYYVRLHLGEESHLIRKPLKWFEGRLDPARFVRVHRSAIVNVERLREIRRLGDGDHVVVMPGDRAVPLSRAGREALDRLLG